MIRAQNAFVFVVALVFAGNVFLSARAQEPAVYVCPMHPEVQAKVAGKCPKCNMALVVGSPSGSAEEFYACPMHPDIMAAKAGTCPKCFMSLVRMAPPEVGEYDLRLETKPAAPKPGEKVRLRFQIFHPKTGEQVKEFNILHDMPFHLFVLSQDLESFEHIHPTKQPDGSFIIETTLPKPGYFKIFSDFFPAGGTPQVIQRSLATAGYGGDLSAGEAKLTPDRELVKAVAGLRCELKFDPAEPVAGKPAVLKYNLTDERTGRPVTDLEPYLGALGHTLILSEDASDYLHSHPVEMVAEGVARDKVTGGPEVAFDTFFPRPGHYRIWSQFQRRGRVITVSFTVFVSRLKSS